MTSAGTTSASASEPSSTSRLNPAPPSGTLYTAARPAPAPQANRVRSWALVRLNRVPIQALTAAALCRGAPSRPNDAPTPTATIWISPSVRVASNGSPGRGVRRAWVTDTASFDTHRRRSHHATPTTAPPIVMATTRRAGLACSTPIRKVFSV